MLVSFLLHIRIAPQAIIIRPGGLFVRGLFLFGKYLNEASLEGFNVAVGMSPQELNELGLGLLVQGADRLEGPILQHGDAVQVHWWSPPSL